MNKRTNTHTHACRNQTEMQHKTQKLWKQYYNNDVKNTCPIHLQVLKTLSNVINILAIVCWNMPFLIFCKKRCFITNLELSNLNMHLSGPKLDQARALKVHFGKKRLAKTPNEKLTSVLCCFKAHFGTLMRVAVVGGTPRRRNKKCPGSCAGF